MDRSETYRGFEIGWQKPPVTGAGRDIKIESDDLVLQQRPEALLGTKGAYAFRVQGKIEGALEPARRHIDAALA